MEVGDLRAPLVLPVGETGLLLTPLPMGEPAT